MFSSDGNTISSMRVPVTAKRGRRLARFCIATSDLIGRTRTGRFLRTRRCAEPLAFFLPSFSFFSRGFLSDRSGRTRKSTFSRALDAFLCPPSETDPRSKSGTDLWCGSAIYRSSKKILVAPIRVWNGNTETNVVHISLLWADPKWPHHIGWITLLSNLPLLTCCTGSRIMRS